MIARIPWLQFSSWIEFWFVNLKLGHLRCAFTHLIDLLSLFPNIWTVPLCSKLTANGILHATRRLYRPSKQKGRNSKHTQFIHVHKQILILSLSVCAKELSDSQLYFVHTLILILALLTAVNHSELSDSRSKHKYGGSDVTWNLNFMCMVAITGPLQMEVEQWDGGKNECHTYTGVKQQWPDRKLNFIRALIWYYYYYYHHHHHYHYHQQQHHL
jgi:hypothetical protein